MKKLLLILALASCLAGCKKDEAGEMVNPLLGRWDLEYVVTSDGVFHCDSIFFQEINEVDYFVPYIRYIEIDEDSIFIFNEVKWYFFDPQIIVEKIKYYKDGETIKTIKNVQSGGCNEVYYDFNTSHSSLQIYFIKDNDCFHALWDNITVVSSNTDGCGAYYIKSE